jgi:hypothetical protein
MRRSRERENKKRMREGGEKERREKQRGKEHV